jgi:NAD(P) transhydrogenase subunit beta
MAINFYIELAYMLGAVGFVWGLRLLSSPDSARRGNLIAGVGMGLAILAAITMPIPGAANNYIWILSGLAIGGVIGTITSYKVKMTAMPQLVSVFNGFGGACAVLLAIVEGERGLATGLPIAGGQWSITLATLLIGGVTFTGSMLAYLKLDGKLGDNKLLLPRHQLVNQLFLLAAVIWGTMLFFKNETTSMTEVYAFTLLCLLYGASFVVPIGGADMPVVISLLNSFSGISAATAGIIYHNQFMLVGGILVGASGTILTVMMCKAMNRSLFNVLIGGFGGSSAAAGGKAGGDQTVKEVSLNDAAILLNYSKSVIFVPGYGLAVAQAQKVCKEIDDLLSENGVDVKYAIHPVAGRMPGHMNVLLAEADVPYPKLLDLDDSNNALSQADVAVIVGANDVVNPAAENDPSSPIYGMPVLQVWNAKHVIVLKRSMNAGYAGIENPLFFHAKNRMLFGDAKNTLSKLVVELKGL